MFSSKEIAKALIESAKDGAEVNILVKNFEKFLETNHLRALIPNIQKNIDTELQNLLRENSLEIKTSHDISKKTVEMIEKFVGKDGGAPTILEKDEGLLGGFRAKYKGRVYDGSVKNYLKELKVALMN